MTEGDTESPSAPEVSGPSASPPSVELGWAGGLAAYSLAFLVLLVALLLIVPVESLAVQGAVALLAGLLAGWALLKLAHGRGPAALGFYLHPRAVVESVGGVGLGLLVVGGSVGLMAATGSVRWVGDGGTTLEWLAAGGSTLAFLALPAAAEEAVFRGYPLQVLARDWGAGWAIVATSVVFALVHGANPGISGVAFVNLWVAGIFLGVIYLRTGSLWWATGAHLGWNWALGFWVDLPVSGLELVDTPLWTGVPAGPDWLAGGAFGPEGSVLTTPVVVVASILLWRWDGLRPHEVAREADPLMPLPESKPGGGRPSSSSERESKGGP